MERSFNRRAFLEVSGFSVLQALALKAVKGEQNKTREKIKPVILFFQAGAQSPYEFVSPLPESPSQFRGPFSAIRARNGIFISEAFPKVSDVLQKASVVRSIDCENVSHDAEPIVGKEFPKVGQSLTNGGIPYTFIKPKTIFSTHSSLRDTDSFAIPWNEKEERFVPPSFRYDENLKARKALLEKMDTADMEGDLVDTMTANRRIAFELLMGNGSIERAFTISDKQKKRYGDNQLGDAVAIATNFARDGAGMIVIYNEMTTESGSGWDMHSNLEKRTKELAPPTDQAAAALLEDAHEQDFVAVLLTEHGRTPRINAAGGRDHFNVGYLVGSGGSFRQGETIGELDKTGSIKGGEVSAKLIMPTILEAAGLEVPRQQMRIERILGHSY